MAEYAYISQKWLDHQRSLLNQMNQRSEFDEEIIRKYLYVLDLDETKLRESEYRENDVDQ